MILNKLKNLFKKRVKVYGEYNGVVGLCQCCMRVKADLKYIILVNDEGIYRRGYCCPSCDIYYRALSLKQDKGHERGKRKI